MEKVIYVLWRDPVETPDAYAQRLRLSLAAGLRDAGARGLKINVADTAVEPAAGLRQMHVLPQADAFINVWVDSAIASQRQPFDAVIAAHSLRYAAYLVSESQPLRNRRRQPQPGERTEGFAQMALLRRPEKLGYEEWLDIWHNSHTAVAVETQSNFEYIQNLVVRRLTPDGPAYDAIVEECFPAAAMTDPYVFFDAEGDEAKFQHNLKRMMDSVARFIDMERLDVVPTSQYPMF
ncbi:EthD domain-containing protein [Nevskia soli]|uniref:EthD domain-containing protein n=1 Tax=Nevskia soli TaxID=418856 RepID=UPI0004A70BD4|nr:EthD domain-containing protein [Nevskia soli]